MGRQKSWHWEHFHKDGSKANQTHWNATCNYCTKNELGRLELEEHAALDAGSISQARSKDILIAEARGKVNFTTGKLSVMNNHLLSCDYVPTSVRDRALKHKKPNGSESDDSDHHDVTPGSSSQRASRQAPKRSHSLTEPDGGPSHINSRSKKQKAFTVVSVKHTPFTQESQALFNEQLLRAWISAGFSFNSIEDPEVRKLFHDFIPSATVPHRDQLSGTILKRAVSNLEHTLQSEAKGQLATLQCDGWRDVSRKHLVAFMYTVSREAHVTHIHDASDKRKTGENLFDLMDEELNHLLGMGLTPIGIAGDAGSDERKARLLMLKKYPNLLIADCWAHQIALILGDYYKANVAVAVRMDTAIQVIKWFNNHSFALGLLNSEQKQMYTKTKALIMPVVTRWTAQYCALSRLLETWKALQVTVIKHDTELVASVGKKKSSVSRAKTVLGVCRDENWWKEITIIKTHIEPLAVAVNIAQGANTRCDQVVLVLGRLYRDYQKLRFMDRSDPSRDSDDSDHPVTAIIDSIEKRWSKVDQDLFISAFYLNPFINRKLRNGSKLTLSVIMGMVRRLYCRIFKSDTPPPELLRDLVSYENGQDMFSAEAWSPNDLRPIIEKPDGSVDPLQAWQFLDKERPLVQLAIYVFNFVPNSASCERLFSDMGNIKTKKRNRLSAKKTRDCAFLKGELRRQHAKEGTARQRLKRHFGNKSVEGFDADPTGSRLEEEEYLKQLDAVEPDDSDSDEPGNFAENVIDPVLRQSNQSSVLQVAKQLIQAVHDDSDASDPEMSDGDNGVSSSTPLPNLKIRLFFGQKSLIPIKDIFNWSVEAGWDEFWGPGVRHHKEDMMFYELLTRASSEEIREAENGASESTGTRQEPISL